MAVNNIENYLFINEGKCSNYGKNKLPLQCAWKYSKRQRKQIVNIIKHNTMKMKFLVRAIAIAALSVCGVVSASAQEMSIEATAGVGFSQYKYGGSDGSGVGFRVGAIGEISIPKVKGLYGNAGLMLSLENFKSSVYGSTISMDPYFLHIPIHLGYSYSFSDKLACFAEFGPYVGVGLFGNLKEEYMDFNPETDEEFEAVYKRRLFNKENGERVLNPVQFGLGVKVGIVAFEHFKLSFGWDWNLLKVFEMNELPDGKNSHNNGYLTLSYVF